MKKYILTIILYIFVLPLGAQTICGFEKKLDDFRYSLYTDIANAIPNSSPDISKIDRIIYKDSVFSTKVQKFMVENKQEIVAYQTNILKNYQSELKIDIFLSLRLMTSPFFLQYKCIKIFLNLCTCQFFWRYY